MNEGPNMLIRDAMPSAEREAAAIKNWTGTDTVKRMEVLIMLTGIPGFNPSSWDGKAIDELVQTDFSNLPSDLQVELADCVQVDGDSFEL